MWVEKAGGGIFRVWRLSGGDILVARIFSLGSTIGLSALLFLGGVSVSPVVAGHSAWSGYSSQPKRPQFRPWQRTETRSPLHRWRPQVSVAGRSVTMPLTGGRYLPDTSRRLVPLLLPGTRYAAPATAPAARSFGANERFRPSVRPAAGGLADDTHQPGYSAQQRQIQAQFRPRRQQAKQTYEQIQAAAQSVAAWPGVGQFDYRRAGALRPSAPYWAGW